jgi:hypothetical protein
LDGGNWLAFGHAIFGERLRSSTLLYPPVVPIAAAVSERLLGTFWGLKVLEFVAGAAPPLGVYILLYKWGLGWRAIVLATLLAASAATGEAMAWGGYPQLIGLGILPLLVLALDRFITSKSPYSAIAPAILVVAALATNEFIGPLTLLIALIYLMLRYAFLTPKDKRNSGRNVFLGIGLSIVLALPLAPIYIGLLAGILNNERTKAALGSTVVAARAGIGAVLSDLPIFWLVALALALLAPLILLVSRERLSILSATVLIPCLGILFATGENRLAYVLPLGMVFGLAAWWRLVEHLPDWTRQAFGAVMLTCAVVDVLFGTRYFATQSAYYRVITPNVVQGFAVLESRSTQDELIAVSPVAHGWVLGWWVEGAVHRRTIYAGDPIWLNYADERARNALANSIFASGNTVLDSARLAHRDGASFIFVDKDWSGYAEWIATDQSLDPRMVIYENRSVVIIDTREGTQ